VRGQRQAFWGSQPGLELSTETPATGKGARPRRSLAAGAAKNRLASAVGKQDDSGVHHATAANGNQAVSVAAALLAGPAAKEEAVSQ